MKHFYTLLIAMMAVSASAQNKINSLGCINIEKFRNERAAVSRAGISDSVPSVGAIVRLNPGNTAACLAAKGYEVTSDLGDMAVVRVPITEIETIAGMPQVKSISFGGKRRHKMKNARSYSMVDQAHNGMQTSGFATNYTGEGVILGIMDGGLDPNHLNFKNRVQRLWHFNSDDGSSKEYTALNIGTFTTDDSQETHATHVAGIMAGGYMGEGSYMNGSTKTTGSIPHYGVAPDATLAFSCGQLYDANILQGVENIISYAEAQGKPVAVNLSLGSNSGPHDGTDDFSAALDRLGQRGLICVAAGNEGEDNITIEKTFTSSQTSLKTLLYYNNRYANGNYGYLDIWASDGQPVKVSISNCNSSGTLSNTTTISSATSGNGTRITKGVKSGTIYAYAGVDANNGRYNVLFDFNVALPSSGRFAITVEGKAGQTVNIYFDGYSQFTNSYSNNSTTIAGFTPGTPDNSISGMACGSNILPVGAYATTTSWYNLGGTRQTNDQSTGSIATFSSYGRDFSGRKLPLIAAPGTTIQSSFSRYYVDGGYGDDYGEDASGMVATAKNGSNTDYWGPMDGTSMATPFMTGVLGLWLQANPNLTMSDVLKILENTSSNDSHTAAAPDKFGYGKVNAIEGLKYLLELNAIDGIQTDDDRRLIITSTPDGYDVFVADAEQLTATIYDLQGRMVGRNSATGNSVKVSATSLNSGVYILEAATPALRLTRKVTLK